MRVLHARHFVDPGSAEEERRLPTHRGRGPRCAFRESLPLHGISEHRRCCAGIRPMKPAPFELLRPYTVPEALALLSDNADVGKLLAGGQSLVPMMNFRVAAPEVLIDLNRIASLVGIWQDGGWLRI